MFLLLFGNRSIVVIRKKVTFDARVKIKFILAQS